MKYHIWMLYEMLSQKYECEMFLKEKAIQNIQNVRLYDEDSCDDEETLYVERGTRLMGNDDSRVYCRHRSNYFVVESTNINEIFNQIISHINESQNWINNINIMIANNCLLSDVLSEFSEKLPFPIMVLDVSQTALAISENYGKGSIDKNWDQMIDTGSLGVETISVYNELYKESIFTKDFYYIPANPFPYPSYNRNIYVNDEFMGFLSLILLDKPLSEAHRGWYYIAWECISNWVQLHIGQNDLLMRNSVFNEILSGNYENLNYFKGLLSTFGWKDNCNKQIIVLGCVSNHLNMNAHIAKLLNLHLDHLFANEYQDKLVIICNVDQIPLEEQLQIIQPIIINSGYYGGSSNIFNNLKDTPHFLLQAMLPFWTDTVNIGVVSPCQNHILPYIFHLLKTSAKMSLTHPALLLLQEYDEAHKSDYHTLLYTYLKNQCNQTETANQLHMHRSSLLRKLTAIQELTGLDFNDYNTRLHLMISYELDES